MKKITPRKTLYIFCALLALAAACALIGRICNIGAFVIAGLLFLLVAVVFDIAFYRCPHCGKPLGHNSVMGFCPCCGKKIEE